MTVPRRRPRTSRVHINSSADQREIFWISKSGHHTETASEPFDNTNKRRPRYFIQRVRAGQSGSHWATVETAGNAQYAIDRATALALSNHHSYRVTH